MSDKKNIDIAIVGMSCMFPDATTLDEFWDNLAKGHDSVIEVPKDRIDHRYFDRNSHLQPDRFYCMKGAFTSDVTFNPIKYGFLPATIDGMDPEHLGAFKLACMALDDAGVFEKKIPIKNGCGIIGKANNVGLVALRAIDILHTGEQLEDILKVALPNAPIEDIQKVKKEFQKQKGPFGPDTASGVVSNLMASLIANKLDMQGTAYTLDAACASSFIAIQNCIAELVSGRADIALAGAAHFGQNPMFWSTFSKIGALSRKEQISPFSEDADGLIIGEGAGCVVLKTLDKALKDKDRIYAVIKGLGVSSDGAGTSIMAPSTKGQIEALKRAWDGLDLDPNDIGYLEAHGTATTIGDKVELNTISTFFNKESSDRKIYLGSVKSNIGHTMPAAGMAGLIKTALALYNRKIPATLHCEKPMKGMAETRFSPVQELIDWDGKEIPTIAGINSFGFGGINAHMVLEAYHAKEEIVAEVVAEDKEKVIAVSAPTKEELLDKLDKLVYTTNIADQYRLVLFNPTVERINKAKNVISKNKPWKGRMDIWFTNSPLFAQGSQLAFLYPGFDPMVLANTELDSLLKYFNLSNEEIEIDPLINKESVLFRSLLMYRNSIIMTKSLEKLGIVPDLNAGHSVGEWFAATTSGLVSENDVETMLIESTSAEFADDSKLSDIYFIALGCGIDKSKSWIDSIPDLYLANDNCNNQILLCGRRDSVEALIEILKKEQVYYQILPFKSGFHTPFIADQVSGYVHSFKKMQVEDYKIPIWSATTLEVYPETEAELLELTARHMTEPIRFRELIEKLYKQEKAKVFIQVGGGSLVGFVDNILKEEDYAAIGTVSNVRTSLNQLRRVLALLHIEGRDVDMSFMGIEENKSKKLVGEEILLQRFLPLITDFPMISDLAQRYGTSGVSPLPNDIDNPVAHVLNDNMQEMARIQAEMVNIYQHSGIPKYSATTTTTTTTTTNLPIQGNNIQQNIPQRLSDVSSQKKEDTFEELFDISLDQYPFVKDHTIVKQPKDWAHWKDLNPVIPMTMTLELLGEIANKKDPTRKLLHIGPVNIYQWMIINQPFKRIIEGKWKDKDTIYLNIKEHVNGEFKLGDSYPLVPAEYEQEIDLGKPIIDNPSIESIYKNYMFHGEKYQAIKEVTHITKKGVRALIKHAGGKGSLLDCMGQIMGMYSQITLTELSLSFPVKVDEIKFYQDISDQEGDFECICLITGLNDNFLIGDIIFKRDNKVWCVAKGWYNRRIDMYPRLWKLLTNASTSMLSEEVYPNVINYFDHKIKSVGLDFQSKQYLNYKEKEHYESLQLNKRRGYLNSCILLKDIARLFMKKEYGKSLYPVEIFTGRDEKNKPYVYGIDELEGVHVSLSHKEPEVVATISHNPVGIDIELMEQRSQGFMDMVFTQGEIELLKDRDNAEWTTRFWVAKESYGKMKGVGLKGNPKQFEVESIDGEILTIRGTQVLTTVYKNKYILGWTV